MNNAMTGTIFIISAASGTGKTSLVKALLERMNGLAVSVSHTTRQPRPAEQNGVHYHFVSIETFKADIAGDKFFEYAKVFGNYYGTSVAGVETLLAQGMDVILEIDWQGALQVMQRRPDAVSIFILPPSQQALRERLADRGQDSSEVIETRLAGSLLEMQQCRQFDYLVVNDVFEHALGDLVSIITAHRLRTERQCVTQATLLQSLLTDIKVDS